MRTIKFRAWDTVKKQWVANGESMDLNYCVRYNSFLFDNDQYDLGKNIELVQFTGLKDKNGVEIYEGDIVKMIVPIWENYPDGAYNDPPKWEGTATYIGEVRTYLRGIQIVKPKTIIEYDGDKKTHQKTNNKNLLSRGVNTEVIGNIYDDKDLLG